jgi:hypothetical protein
MFDMMKMVSFRIKADDLAATAGMMIQLCDSEEIRDELSAQVLRQITIAGINPDEVIDGTTDETLVFHIPIAYAMIVAQTLIDNINGEHSDGCGHLMRAWHPCMDEINLLVRGERYPDMPFDEFGNCMN